jgi:hypothetical protein
LLVNHLACYFHFVFNNHGFESFFFLENYNRDFGAVTSQKNMCFIAFSPFGNKGLEEEESIILLQIFQACFHYLV